MAQAVKRSGSRKTVNATNLKALGAERLANILIDLADDDPSLKRRLRMELATEVGAADLAIEIGKRLTAIEARRSRIHWRKYRAFVRDLDLQRAMIFGPLATLDARLALGLAWRFLTLAEGIFGQVDDARGQVEQVFRLAATQVGEVVRQAKPEPTALAAQVVTVLENDREQVLDALAAAIVPALDAPGLTALRNELRAASSGRSRPSPTFRTALKLVADAQGDIDGYIATFSAAEVKLPWAGAQIARRLLGAGKVTEALAALETSAPSAKARAMSAEGADDWEEVQFDALEANGEAAYAQELRWAAFERSLSAGVLRAYLKRLPEFDDVEAEDRAMAYAQAFSRFGAALRLFTDWPAGGAAAQLVLTRTNEIEVSDPDLLEAAARMLEVRYPLAASLLLRPLVEDALRWAKADRYKTAQRQLAELAALEVHIDDWRGAEPHFDFIARMRQFRRYEVTFPD